MAEPSSTHPRPAAARPVRLPFTVEPDIDGPRVRLGLLWFVVVVGAAASSPVAVAVVVSGLAVLATDEVLRRHLFARRPGAVMAAAPALGALAGLDGLLAGTVVAVALAPVLRLRGRGAPPAVPEVGLTLGAALATGLATGALVLLAVLGSNAAVTVVVLVSVYDAGSFLFGAGSPNRAEGPLAGILAVGVLTFPAWALNLSPLGRGGAVAVGVAVAALAPIGPALGTVLVGRADQPARFVRRLDSWLLALPGAACVAAAVVS